MNTEIFAYQRQLPLTLKRIDPMLSESILQAFSTIPRHMFLDHYYVQQAENPQSWIRCEREDAPGWYEQIYQDQALPISIDSAGRILSSSSQPRIMADMLQALDLQVGMRVLEIGTGSGYNAALLAHLTDDPRLVTTVDLHTETIERAKQTLPQVVGEGMTIAQADGHQGYAANAPYERIIATASCSLLPQAWMEQLAPGGIVVGVLQPRLARLGGLLKAHKGERGLEGSILQLASFMELRSGESVPKRVPLDFRAPVNSASSVERFPFHPQYMHNSYHFTFFLHYALSDLRVFQKKGAFFFYRETSPQGYLVFRPDTALNVELRGDTASARSLWTSLVRSYSLWDRLGQPAVEQYLFEMDKDGQALSLETAFGRIWPFI